MRRYNIVFGVLLILPIIDFALAAPVPVQEKGQACVNVVHRSEDVITVLGKRVVGDELEKAAEEYFNTWGKPVDSSGAPASSGSAPSEPDHGSTNIGQTPAPNPAASTANPDHALPVVPSSPSPAVPLVHAPLPAPASLQVGLIHGLTGAHTPQLDPNPVSSTDENFDWDYWMNVKDPPAPPKAAPLKAPASTGPIFDWKKLIKLKDSPSPGPASSQSSNPKPGIGSTFSWNKLKNLKDQISPGPVSSRPLDQKPSTGPTFNWNKLKNLKDQILPGPVSSQPLDQKPSTGSTFSWKNLVNLKDQPPPGPASSKPSNQNLKPSTGSALDLNNLKEPPQPVPPGPAPELSPPELLDQKPATTGSTFSWKNLVNLKEPASLEPSSSTSNPKPQTDLKSGLLKFTENLLDKWSLLDPLPRPKPTTSAPPEFWYFPKLQDAGPSNTKPTGDSMPEVPLKFKAPKTGTTEKPDVDVVHEPPSSPDTESSSDYLSTSSTGSQRVDIEAATYAAKGKAIDLAGPEYSDSDSDW